VTMPGLSDIDRVLLPAPHDIHHPDVALVMSASGSTTLPRFIG